MTALDESGLDGDREATCPTDLGDDIVLHLAGNLAGLQDHLARAGFRSVADLVGDLVEVVDSYIFRQR